MNSEPMKPLSGYIEEADQRYYAIRLKCFYAYGDEKEALYKEMHAAMLECVKRRLLHFSDRSSLNAIISGAMCDMSYNTTMGSPAGGTVRQALLELGFIEEEQ